MWYKNNKYTVMPVNYVAAAITSHVVLFSVHLVCIFVTIVVTMFIAIATLRNK